MSRTSKTMLLLLVLLFALPLAVYSASAVTQRSAVIENAITQIDMADSTSVVLKASVLPATASQKVVWKSSNTSIATVSSKGKVVFKKPGTVTIGVRPSTQKKAWAKCTIVVTDSLRPTSMEISCDNDISMIIGDKLTVEASYEPADALQTTKFVSSKPSVATVTSDGVITAKKTGVTLITVVSTRNTSLKRTIRVTVKTLPAPKSILLTPTTNSMNVGDTLQLTASGTPATASQSFGWKSSNTSIASVTSAGLITAKKKGTVKITCYSKVKTSVKTIRTIKVIDPYTITSVTLNKSGTIYLSEDDTMTLVATVKPSAAIQTVKWTSTDSSIVSVSDGKLTAKKPGTVTISVASTVMASKSDSVKIIVLDTTRTTEIPARTTDKSGITANLAKIDAIRISAYNELYSLVAKGSITSSEMETRKSIIINAFAMYRFPWMTTKRQAYWSSSYSGGKDFLTGKVYYGLPYIQCGTNNVYTNRMYNVTKALNAGYYTKSSGNYYLMTTKRLNGMYVGNDCSAFVSMSTWGTSHSASYLATRYMATSTFYNTISGYSNLRPGDALVKSGSHTVMFLYFTNSAKTKMMIIEQGGGTNPGGTDMHNTVTCSVVNVSSYSSGGYKIRRANKLSKS